MKNAMAALMAPMNWPPVAADPQVTILASGSEVSIAMEARAALKEDGIGARVVSVPCMELFEQQNPATQADILGDTPIRIAVEAAIRQSWDRFLRPQDIFIGMDGFGASAPADNYFNISALPQTQLRSRTQRAVDF